MNMPFFKYDLFDFNVGLIFAVILGIGFGFFLESGGFSSSRKLSSQFYLKDFTVFKGMFTAVVVAMLGIYIFSYVGILNLSKIFINPTYVIPQIIAGLIFGFGFIMSGLCPGTALVSFASGKLDGLITILGVMFGIFLFGESYEFLRQMINTSYLGPLLLNQLLGISKGVIVIIIITVAGLSFWQISLFEKRNNIKLYTVTKTQKLLLSILIVLGVFIGLSKDIHGTVNKYLNQISSTKINGKVYKSIGVHQLAEWIVQKKDDLLIVDLRSIDKFEEYHIPSMNSIHFSNLPNIDVNNTEVVIYTYKNIDNVNLNDILIDFPRELYILDGGIETWRKQVLFPDLTLIRLEKNDILKIKRLSTYFGGRPFELDQSKNPSTKKFSREGC